MLEHTSALGVTTYSNARLMSVLNRVGRMVGRSVGWTIEWLCA